MPDTPQRISVDDLVEAALRGAMRAVEARAGAVVPHRPPIVLGLILYPEDLFGEQYSAGQGKPDSAARKG